jgi:hypothetical protein
MRYSILKSDPFTPPPSYGKMRKPDPVTVPMLVKRALSGGSQAPAGSDIAKVSERQRKSRPWLLVDDGEESNGTQANDSA